MDFGFELELDPSHASGIAPGAAGSGRLSIWATEKLPTVFAGQKFELREGTRVVGHGTIVDAHVN